MTLEGEYYDKSRAVICRKKQGRNPHDIGRRILPIFLNWVHSAFLSRNPHDIGRRILLEKFYEKKKYSPVAILMTLEGEYYWADLTHPTKLPKVAILMTLEGEYYPEFI